MQLQAVNQSLARNIVSFSNNEVRRFLQNDWYMKKFVNMKWGSSRNSTLKYRVQKLAELALNIMKKQNKEICSIDLFDVTNFDDIIEAFNSAKSLRERKRLKSAILCFVEWMLKLGDEIGVDVKKGLQNFKMLLDSKWQSVSMRAKYKKNWQAKLKVIRSHNYIICSLS